MSAEDVECVAVRRAEAQDAPALVELASAVGGEPGGWLISDSTWRSVGEERRYVRAIRRHPNAAVLVAELDGELVGRLSLARDPHPASHHVADLGLMVSGDHRRRGVGRALLEAAERWGREAGVSKLELHVFPHNDAALALYEACGYQREGLRRGHYRRASGEIVDAILMSKLIG